ncbi:MAG: protein kinase domain-containing protein [Planctomycetota bacterium]
MTDGSDLSISDQIDIACDEFEALWHSSSRKSIEEFLRPDMPDEHRCRLFRELLLLELDLLRQRQLPKPDEASLHQRFPQYASVIAEVSRTSQTIVPLRGSHDQHLNKGRPVEEQSVTQRSAEQLVTPADRQSSNQVRYFGDYELLSEIARGGMGVVYRARQTNLNRIVALKMILAGQLASEEEVQRFRTEAEAAANLDHPGIVPIYEIGQHDGQHFFSMGYVDGCSLADRVRNGPLPPKDAAELTKKIAEAIAFAHSRNVIHRDLKPANVLLDSNGEPRVTDFGLARKTDNDSGMTRTGAVMGTPSYMPPEQAAGKTSEVGPLSDVYSLGAILYCLLTGRPPFQAVSWSETLQQVQKDEPISIRLLMPFVARDLETICHKCLNKDFNRRYQSARQLRDDLQRWLIGEPILARPVSRAERILRWVQRNRMATAAAALAVLTLMAMITVPWFVLVRERQHAERLSDEHSKTLKYLVESQRNEFRATEALDKVQRAEKARTKLLWSSLLAEARARTYSGTSGQRFQALAAIREAAKIQTDLTMRNEAIAALRLVDFEPTAREFETQPIAQLQHEDGHSVQSTGTGAVATILPDTKIVEIKDGKGTALCRLQHPLHVETLQWRRDGKMLAAGGIDCCVHIWNIPEGDKQCILEGHQSGINRIEFTPDGSKVLTSSYDGTSAVWDTMSGQRLLRTLSAISGPFSSDGTMLENEGQTLLLADARECRVLHHGTIGRGGDLSRRVHGVWSGSFSPDSRLLATGQTSGIKLWDVRSGRLLAGFDGNAGVVFAPDGSLWTVEREGIARRSISLDPKTNVVSIGPPERISVPGAFSSMGNCRMAVSPDGQYLAIPDRELNVAWVIDTDSRSVRGTIKQPRCMDVCFSPDSRLLVASSWAWSPPQPVSIVELETLDLVGKIEGSTYARTEFCPDSSILFLAASDGDHFYDPESWDLVRTIPRSSHLPGHVSFSRTGSWGVSLNSLQSVRLFNSASGDELATLIPPVPMLISSLSISPDDRFLAVPTESNQVFLWDLDLINSQLDEMNLAWSERPQQVIELTKPLTCRGADEAAENLP